MDSLIQVWRDFWLSRRVRRAIETYSAQLFSPEERKVILEKLAGSTFPLLEQRTAESLRVKLAILVLSEGKRDRFQANLELAKRDWRDVLVPAGMARTDWIEVLQRKGVSI
jgi:hypothetical protein